MSTSPAQLDIAGAFVQYRRLTTQLAGCPTTVVLTDDAGNPLPEPIPAGAAAGSPSNRA